MRGKRWLMISAVFALAVVLAAPATAQGNGKGNGGGKGGGGGQASTVAVARVTIHDDPGTRLYSDGLWRINPDADGDGYLELALATGSTVTYQDSLLGSGDAGTHPDPCAQFTVGVDKFDGGQARALFDAQSCSFLNPEYADDARTFTLVFDKNDTADPLTGGSCACDQMRYLVDAEGSPAPMYNGELAKTSFAEDADTCTLGIAAGAIVTDSDHGFTASQQIVAWPYEELMGKKGNGSQKIPGMTSVNINFRTDRINAGERKNWQLQSQAENILIDNPDAPDDLGTRVVTSTGEQRFELSGGTMQCVDITLPFQVTFEKFEIEGQ